MHTPPLILVADDEQDTALLLERICIRSGFNVTLANDGLEALRLSQELIPDLLLLDIQMPAMNGFEVIKQLRDHEVTRQIPIIIITAAATRPEDAAHGIGIGADDFIIKPFNYTELVARMRSKIRAKELEESLHKRTEELGMLVGLGADLNQTLSIEELALCLLNFLHHAMKADVGLVYILGSEDQRGVTLSMRETGQFSTPSEPNLQPLLKAVSSHAGRMLTPEETYQLFEESDMQAGVVVPLTYHLSCLGMFAIGHRQAGAVGDDELRVMTSVAQQVSLALRNAQLFGSLQAYATDLEGRVEERTAALQKAQEQLIRSEKLASLGRLSGEIAHEINNPLQPIMHCLEAAIENTVAGEMVDLEDLELAMNEVGRLKRMVTRLLDFARPDSGGVVSLDLQEIVNEVLALTHKRMSNTHIKLLSDLQPIPVLKGNPDQLKQVFLNVTINAVDAMSEQSGGQLSVKLWHDNKDAHLLIQDTGVGIPQDQLSQIFEPFFSTKVYGSGLGLAVSHTLIEAHGGKIEIKSKVGKGTHFHITLPLA